MRYISILKAGGINYENEDGPIISITIGENGIGDVEYLPDTDPNATVDNPLGGLSQTDHEPTAPSQSRTPSTITQPTQSESQTDFAKSEGNTGSPRTPKKNPHSYQQGVSPLKNKGKRKRLIADSEEEDDEDVQEIEEEELYAWGDELDLDTIQ